MKALLLRTVVVLVCYGLVACGSGGSNSEPESQQDEPSAGTTPPMECGQDGYPCNYADVPLATIEHSLALSEQVAQKLDSGVNAEEIETFLLSQPDIAEVTVDGSLIGFRLAGGRPMLVDADDEQQFLPSDAASASQSENPQFLPGTAPKIGAARGGTLRPRAVTGDAPQKRALVLSPFRYEENFGNTGELVAAALNEIRGYAGNITYLATVNEFDPQVTVDVLTQLEDYDVIHIDTHGGTLCKKKESPKLKARGKIKDMEKCAAGITDFLVQRFHGTARDLQSLDHPGIVHYRGRLHQSIAVTADFFRHYYPSGLSNTVFVLGSCNTFRDDMADAIAGETSIFISWDQFTEFSLVKNTSVSLLDSLGQGLTVGEAFARMPAFSASNPAAEGSQLLSTPRKAGGDLRIRDLITVRDNLTEKLVTDTSGIEVKETPGDGENDNLDLEFTIDGITPERLNAFYVNMVINDKIIGHLDLAKSGIKAGDFRYQISTPVPLPFDVEEGQALNMEFWIPLPDLGENYFRAAPKVNERDDVEVGSEWRLTSTATTQRTDDTTVKTATVTFVAEPNQNPQSQYRYFEVKSGTLHVQRDYEDTLGCRFNVNATLDIPAGAPNTTLKFDSSSGTILLDGLGSAPNETISVTGSCGDSASVKVGGVYFMAEDAPVNGDSVQGSYDDGAKFPTVFDWTLTKLN